MSEPKTPQDHQPKKTKPAEPDEFFTFISQGEPVTAPVRTEDALGAAFVMDNRRREDVDFVITAFEEMAGEGPERKATIAAFKAMTAAEWRKFQSDFRDHLGATLGE